MELRDNVAVITGASSGIGRGVARALAEAGMKLVLTARRKNLLDGLAAELSTEVVTVAGDLTDAALPQRLIDTAVERFGSCDVVFNNAGVMIVGRAQDIDLEAACQMVRLNVEAVYRLAILAMRHMLGQGHGYLINTSSILGTKVRALYQRKKGRDLFDLWAAFTTPHAQPERVIRCFLHYLDQEGHKVSRAEFEQNLYEKLGDPRFIADIGSLVVADSDFDPAMATEFVLKRLAILIPGEPWKGKASAIMPSLTKAAE